MIMALHDSSSTHNDNTREHRQLTHVFHDFLGMKTTDSRLLLAPKIASSSSYVADARLSEESPSASASGGGRGAISTTSDLGSQRQVGSHLEGVPFYGPRSDIFGPESRKELAGYKRSNSDSAFMVSSRDGIPQLGPDSLESCHLMKIIHNGAGGERPRRFSHEEVLFGMQTLRPSSASLVLQPPSGNRIDVNLSKREKPIPINVGPAMQYPSHGGQFTPFMHQVPQNRFRDTNAGPSIISQSAADEGSRTGIKGPGILSSINVSSGSGATERNASGLHLSGSNLKSTIHISQPESPTPPSRPGFTSTSRQMTIFYGGQAHVFDDVHPNKADVIMALAGSNGGSWSTTFLPESAMRPVSQSCGPGGENETGIASKGRFPCQFHRTLPIIANSSHGVSPNDRILTPRGGHQGSIVAKEIRNQVQASEPERTTEEKGEL